MSKASNKAPKTPSNKTPKSRTLMYVQKTQYLNSRFADKTALKGHLDNMTTQYPGLEWAFILHNKDFEKGVKVDDHIHIAFAFKNPRMPTQLAKDMLEPIDPKTGNVSGQTVEIFTGGSAKQSMFSYLIHATPNARDEGKHLYDVSEVTANFDYEGLVSRATLSANSKTLDIEDIRARIISGDIILKDFFTDGTLGSKEEMALFYAKHKNKIGDAIDARYKILMKSKGAIDLEIIYIQGPSGSGKTTIAKQYAERKYGDYFMSGSSNDTVQDYMGEPVAIFDDARPTDFKASDWLKLLDPFNNKSTITSRFYNKYLAVKCIILTTTTPFKDFFTYAKEKGAVVEPVDQFIRRFNLVINVHTELDDLDREWAIGNLYAVKKVKPYEVELGEDKKLVKLSHDVELLPYHIKELIPEKNNQKKAQDFLNYFSHATNPTGAVSGNGIGTVPEEPEPMHDDLD